jgi:hypothetical protein
MSNTRGEKSIPPIGGNTLRMGPSRGSVSRSRKLTAGCSRGTFVHETTTAATTISEYRSINRISNILYHGACQGSEPLNSRA